MTARDHKRQREQQGPGRPRRAGGLALFSVKPVDYAGNPAFFAEMGLIALGPPMSRCTTPRGRPGV